MGPDRCDRGSRWLRRGLEGCQYGSISSLEHRQHGNYIANNVIGGSVLGSNTALQSIETTFHQDLNGDGVIGIPVSTAPALMSTNQAGANRLADNGPVNAIEATTNHSFVFAPNFGQAAIARLRSSNGYYPIQQGYLCRY